MLMVKDLKKMEKNFTFVIGFDLVRAHLTPVGNHRRSFTYV
jgi:hypothetical protein